MTSETNLFYEQELAESRAAADALEAYNKAQAPMKKIKMRKSLENLNQSLDAIDTRAVSATHELIPVIKEILHYLDMALPVDKSNDL